MKKQTVLQGSDSFVEIPEEIEKLDIYSTPNNVPSENDIVESLRRDNVVLVQGLGPDAADELICGVAEQLGLIKNLKLQAGLAARQGHRENIGAHYMSVNDRSDYQFIPPHSEGSRFVNMQLASFYCFENATDGGESIMMNVDDASPMWCDLKERVVRAKLGRKPLTNKEIMLAKQIYRVSLPDDILQKGDKILSECDTGGSDTRLFEVLTAVKKTYSAILGREIFTYWDSVASVDYDSAREFLQLLKFSNLLKVPSKNFEIEHLDNAYSRRVWSSGVKYHKLFKRKITYKLAPGDFIVQNNLTWTHSATNWTPGSGVRKIAAAFA